MGNYIGKYICPAVFIIRVMAVLVSKINFLFSFFAININREHFHIFFCQVELKSINFPSNQDSSSLYMQKKEELRKLTEPYLDDIVVERNDG